MQKKVAVIGSGFAGLSAAAMLAKHGHEVTVYEKNNSLGGRAMKFEADGFTFDMGPSWYWMPDLFEQFYQQFGHTTSDFYELKRLDPSYRVFFGKDDVVDIPSSIDAVYELFEKLEPRSSPALKNFLQEAEYKYNMSMNNFVHRPSLSWLEFVDPKLIPAIFKMHFFRSISQYIKKRFKNPKLVELLEFPVIFLGAKPSETPALYSLMNHADINLGTWYPQGGMFKVIEAFEKICRKQKVKFSLNSNVERINIDDGVATSLCVNGKDIPADLVLATADYHHVDQHLLPKQYRSYSPKYWNNRKMSPSCMIFYLGLNKKISHFLHHTLFFDEDRDTHMEQIFDRPQWPTAPLLYVSCPSKTDNSLIPDGGECLFVLIPVAVGLEDTEETRQHYYDLAINRMEHVTDQKLREHIIFKRSYAHKDYVSDFNAMKGNAFGLANTLMQTAVLKPKIRSNKVKNLFFAGQLTTPGPGVPPCIISGQVVATEVQRELTTGK